MKAPQVDTKLYKLAHDAAMNLQDVMIIQLADNLYDLYNCYSIERKSSSWLVSVRSNLLPHHFYNLKNAVTWCMYDYRNRLVDARQILELDRQLTAAAGGVQLHQRLIKRSKTLQQSELYSAKLREELTIQEHALQRIQHYINNATVWQKQKFKSKAREST